MPRRSDPLGAHTSRSDALGTHASRSDALGTHISLSDPPQAPVPQGAHGKGDSPTATDASCKKKRRTLLHSFRDAIQGVWLCLRSERNMRIHAAACGYVLFFAFKTQVSRGEMACLLLAIGMVTAAETMNTAVEKLCDHVCPDYHPHIGKVKDLAAGAVVLSAAFAALCGCAVFLRPELWEAVGDILGTAWKLGAFAASAIVCIILIFVAPLKRN